MTILGAVDVLAGIVHTSPIGQAANVPRHATHACAEIGALSSGGIAAAHGATQAGAEIVNTLTTHTALSHAALLVLADGEAVTTNAGLVIAAIGSVAGVLDTFIFDTHLARRAPEDAARRRPAASAVTDEPRGTGQTLAAIDTETRRGVASLAGQALGFVAQVSTTVVIDALEPWRTGGHTISAGAGHSALTAHTHRVIARALGAIVVFIVGVVVLTVADLGADGQEAHTGLLAGNTGEEPQLAQVGTAGTSQRNPVIDQAVAVVVDAVADLIDGPHEVRADDLSASAFQNPPGTDAPVFESAPIVADLTEREVVI